MNMKGGAAAAAVFVVLATGSWGVLAPAAAKAAIEPAVLEAVESPEVREVASDVAALLESFAPDAEEQVIAAALHRYLADSVYEDEILEDALEIVLTGAWSDTQSAALRSIYAVYAAQDVKPPGGGADVQTAQASAASRGFAEFQPPPGGSSTALSSPSEEEGGPTDQPSPPEDGGFTEPPPPPTGGGGSSDYRP